MVSERPEPWSQLTVNNSKTLNNFFPCFRSLACAVGMTILCYRGALRNKWENIVIFKDYQSVRNRRDYKAGNWVHHPLPLPIHMIPVGNKSAVQGVANEHIYYQATEANATLTTWSTPLAKQPGWWVQSWPTPPPPSLSAHRIVHLIHSAPTKWV